jgi:2-polyprenyl-3-methyl-5-hydroxy-6-metoxy-1,4-benzoquinol methylase
MIRPIAQESRALTATLKQLAELDRYNNWIYEQIRPALGQRILEIGSGMGNITPFLCADGNQVTATDILPSYRSELERMFGNRPNVEIGIFDLNSPAPADYISRPFDSVVCLNVLEHIENDHFALEQMYKTLKAGGKLALLVPAHKILYGEFDRAVGHYRRYEKREMVAKLKLVGFSICKVKYFSIAAALPWLINGRLLKRNYLPSGQTSLANRLVPLFKFERFIGPPCGLSLIAIAQK